MENKQLKQSRPMWLVPYEYTFSVMIYTNGSAPVIPNEAIRNAIAEHNASGTGVGDVSVTQHGIVMFKEDTK
jgi:hypothetical protein